MKTLALTLLLTGVLAAPASAGGLLVVGRHDVLYGPHPVNAFQQRVPVLGKHRCLVGADTPLAALLDSRLQLTVKDYGSCGTRKQDSSGLYVRGVGGEVGKGDNGWVFKVRNRLLSSGAADLASETKSRILWFWCRHGKSGCQRTLVVEPARRSATTGSKLTVKALAYDDDGRAIPARGAKVTAGPGATARTNMEGVAHVRLGDETGSLSVYAEQGGRVRSFPEKVRVR